MAGEPFIWYGVGICAVGIGAYFAYRYLASENVSWADEEEGDLDLEEDGPDLEGRVGGRRGNRRSGMKKNSLI